MRPFIAAVAIDIFCEANPMKFWLKFLIFLLLLSGVGAAAYKPATEYWKKRNQPVFREAEVEQGRILAVRNSTGEIKPVLEVAIGSFVSGPITELHVEFNDRVKKDQLLAKIDPRIYKAAVDRDMATLATRKADVERVEALLQRATNDERRSQELRAENEDYISKTEIDRFHFERLSLAAQLKVAEASVKQAQANLENSEANLGYTEILSPVDGIVTDRKIDPGQTLAAQFQAPELFIIAPDMEKKMHIIASVDETDIGLIRKAKEENRQVKFKVDAYPDDLFEGAIEQIRFSPITDQNVVTYPVVVATTNPDLKLMPGMTANLSFEIEEKEDVVKIPRNALSYYPDAKLVRKEDQKLLDGASRSDDDDDKEEGELSAEQKDEAAKKRNRRHVWVKEGDKLRAIEIVTGITDNKFTEMVSGELTKGQKLVIGVKSKR